MSLPIDIKLPEHFLEEEQRCGYKVTTKQKKIWAVELDLAQHFLEVCKKYDIMTTIYWGTMLGAVRHHGFIPWDDDLDFVVDRKNFNKLLKVPHSEFGDRYFLQTALTDRKFFCSYARLRNSQTTGAVSGQCDSQYNSGIYIDIYVFDGVAPNATMLKIHNFLKHVFLIPIKLHFLGYGLWVKVYNLIVGLFSPFVSKIGAACSFKKADHLSYWIDKTDMCSIEMIPFEFMEVPSIVNRIPFLARRYKDFMQFPPLEERGKWHEGIIHFEPDIPYEEYLLKNVELRAR